MNNKSSGWFSLVAVINFLTALSCCVTLILIPLGIYGIIAAKRYSEYAALSDAQLPALKKQIKGWTIFTCIVCFPVGLVALVPYFAIGDNGIKITTVESEENAKPAGGNEQMASEESSDNGDAKGMEESEIDEKIKKLTDFKNEGIISEEEYQKALAELESKRN